MRKKGDGETDVASSVGRQRPAIKEGDSVVISGGDQRILVRDIKLLGSGKYRGFIHGFSPSFVLQHRGLKVGEVILFGDDDILDRFG